MQHGPGSSGRRQDVQGLRAAAVLFVVAYHAGLPVPGGFTGVDVFFVISGFVITAMLQREWAAGGRIGFAEFYVRRFKRLTPALAVMVSVVMALSALLLPPFGTQQTAAKTALGTMLLAANAAIALTSGGYFDAPAEANPLLNTWSLAVEEQFYLAFPLVLWAGWSLARRARSPRPAVQLVGAIAGASFALALAGSVGHGVFPSWLAGFYSPLTRAWEFAAGALLAMAGAPRLSRPVATAVGAAGSALLAASLWLITRATPFPGPWTLLPVAGTLLLLVAGADAGNPFSRALAAKVPVAIGDWSYSIYLWHWPLIVFAAALWPVHPPLAAAAALSMVPALASFTWVEQPLRALAPRSPGRFAALVAVTLLVPMLLALALGAGARARWWSEWPAWSSARAEDHAATARGCTDTAFDPALCTWNAEATGGTVLVAGDSQADAWADGVIAAAARSGMRTVVTSRSGCPLAAVDTTGDKPLDCPEWQRGVLAWALRERPRVVVIGNRSSGYTRPEAGWRTVRDAQGEPATPEDAPALYGAGLEAVVAALRGAGIGVVVLQGLPEPVRLDQGASLLRLAFPAEAAAAFDPAPSAATRARADAVEARVAAAHPGTVLLDPLPLLCPAGACPLRTGGAAVYLDPWHLTREGAQSLASPLADAITRAGAR